MPIVSTATCRVVTASLENVNAKLQFQFAAWSNIRKKICSNLLLFLLLLVLFVFLVLLVLLVIYNATFCKKGTNITKN